MCEPELKLYTDISEVFDEVGFSTVNKIASDEDVAWRWATDWRWNIFNWTIDCGFDYSLEDDIFFDYNDVEQLQDYAYRYLQHKLNEDTNE